MFHNVPSGRPLTSRNSTDQKRPNIRSRSSSHRVQTPDENTNEYRMRSRSSSNEPEIERMKEKTTSKRRQRDEQDTKPKKAKELKWPDISDNFTRLQKKEFPKVPESEFKKWRTMVQAGYETTMISSEVISARIEARKEFAQHMRKLSPKKFPIKSSSLFESFKEVEKKETKIKSSPKLPTSKLWIHTEKNFATSDCHRLSHIPFIDPHKTSEQEFIKNLWRNFIEGIHGADIGCGRIISEYETYRLFQMFQTQPEFNSDEGKRLFNFTFFTLFPNKYNYRQLQDENLYDQLCQRFDPNYVISYPQSFDGKHDALKSHFCAKCGTINCSYHSVHFEGQSSNTCVEDSKHLGVGTIGFEDVPCSNDCGKFKSDQKLEVESAFSFKSAALNSMFKARIATEANMCQLTKMMNSFCRAFNEKERTCYQYTLCARAESRFAAPKKVGLSSKRFKDFTLLRKNNISNADPYTPCDHDGPCEKAKTNCPCSMNNSACTLDCRCGPTCKVLFPGCRCAPGLCRSDKCPCFFAGWECNPQTCTSCNSDITSLGEEDACCSNIALQHGWKKAVRVGLSTVKNAGYGLFIAQDVEKDELISEYTGEAISDAECDRRGTVYDEMNLSYTFSLIPNHCTIDAFRMGNLMRYANHKFSRENPNCHARIIKVNGEQRIGIYSTRALKPGQELFFDYKYEENHHAHLVDSKKNGAKKNKVKLNE